MRSVSSLFRQAAYAQHTDQVALVLLQIYHADLPAAICVVNNAQNVVSNGVTYSALPFDIELLSDTEDGPGTVTLTICNVDRQIVQAVRSISGAPTVMVSVVLAADPDNVQFGPVYMQLRESAANALVVQMTLAPANVYDEAYPPDDFTPATSQGLFR